MSKSILCLLCATALFTTHSWCQTSEKQVSDIESKVLDTVLSLKEVQDKIKYVENASKGTRHLGVVIFEEPSKESNYYWVKAKEDNRMNYVSHFNFFVDPKTLAIKYYDPVNDTLLNIKAWRRASKNRKK
jgi:hypothetical protein